MAHDDFELVRDVVAGRHDAAEELLLQRCAPTLAYVAHRFDWSDPNELISEIYLHLSEDAWRRLRLWQGRSSIRSYVEQVAFRYCLARAKGLRPTTPLNVDVIAHGDTVLDRLIATEEQAGVTRAIELLPNPRHRLIARKYYIDRCNLAEIASEFRTTLENMHTIMCRLRQQLAVQLKKDFADAEP